MLKSLKLTAATLLLATGASADDLGLGRAATPAEVAAWDIDVRPDGAGLPKGKGTVAAGEEIFSENCAICHGDFGEGVDRWPVLAGGAGTLNSEDPVKTIGSYWPYLSTVYDYVNRAMPFGNAQSLSPDEVYAITAYLLYVNDLVDDEDFELSDENFTSIRMPNEENFFPDDRLSSPVFAKTDVCMENCKDTVEITMRARILDVTPDETAAKAAAKTEEAEVTKVAAAEPAEPAEPAAPAIDAELVKKGAKVFKKCKACHQIGDGAKNRTGPILTDIVGAAAGAHEGFKYSKALKAAAEDGLVWDETALDGFLTKPKKYLPKTKMSFNGLKKEKDRAAIIEYLKANGG